MVSLRSIHRGAIVPLMVLALAGCGGGAKAADAPAPAPSAATSSAPAESLIQKASTLCHLATKEYRPYATLEDSGYTLTLQGAPAGDSGYENIGHATGLYIEDIACVLKAVAAPDSVQSQMNMTRALDGMQKTTWDKMSASWTYHPKDGLRVLLTEAK